MTSGAPILRQGDWTVELDAANGGQIVRADWRGHPILMPGLAGRTAAEQHAGCFPLVPFSNRIRDGQFRFGGREINLPSPEYAAPHALHGMGWRAAWTASASAPGEAQMWAEPSRGAWPWRYRAEQGVRVTADQLQITLSIRNLDTDPMPAGIGLHPYFVRPEGMWLRAGTQGRWAALPGETGLPHRREAAPEDLAASGLDHCFHGWNGHAEFGGTNGLVVSMTASPTLGNLVIYTPGGKPYFCAEPVSHVNNAVNIEGLSEGEQITVLLPGQTLLGTMMLAPRLV